MTTAKTTSAPKAGAEGYWTIQVVEQDRAKDGRRFVCHAAGDLEARGIAGHLAGSDRATVGYDYYRFDNPAGPHALALAIGTSESVASSEAWAAFTAARRA